ncbi:MAG TPA: hypothetical protein VGM88_24970 [Kofleriaceae bacterium]|jgi:hypothetical protein
MLLAVNAVSHFAERLPPDSLRRLATLRVSRFASAPSAPSAFLDLAAALARVGERWGADLCGLLNAMTRDELVALARAIGETGTGAAHELRLRMWEMGARLERGGGARDPSVQPRPILLGGHLVVQAPPRGAYPPAAAFPRPVPTAAQPAPPPEEPDSLDELLAAADRAIGVRLGPRGPDKGAWGTRAASLLGIVERGEGEPDWRGDVEVKTVPVALDPAGRWRVVEDPAIAMVGEGIYAKLSRTLWLARTDLPGGDAAILSWYLLEWDAEVARLVNRYLHERPKGPAGTDQRAVYLHKRFFADAGLLATLNGWGAACE